MQGMHRIQLQEIAEGIVVIDGYGHEKFAVIR